MKENYLLNEYYKRRLYGQRSRLARAIDFTILRVLLFILFFLWFSGRFGASLPAYLLSFIFVMLFSVAAAMWASIRMDACKRRVNEALKQELIREKILLMPGNEYIRMVNRYCRANKAAYPDDCMIYALQRSEKLNRDVLLGVYRTARKRGYGTVALFSSSIADDDARSLLRRNDVAIIPQGDTVFSAMAELNSLVPSEDDIRSRILLQIREERDERKKSAKPFVLGRVRRYWLVSAALLGASFFVEHTLYYRLMAGVCALFASLSLWLEKSAPPKSS